MTAIQWEYYNCCVISDVIIGPVLNGQEIGNRTGYRYQVTDQFSRILPGIIGMTAQNVTV